MKNATAVVRTQSRTSPLVWVVRVGGDDGELRPCHCMYDPVSNETVRYMYDSHAGKRGPWGTPIVSLHIRYSESRLIARQYDTAFIGPLGRMYLGYAPLRVTGGNYSRRAAQLG